MERTVERQILEGRYFNCNGYSCAIVAVITFPIDWAAYMGGHDGKAREEETIAFVAKHGAKLSQRDARHFFPQIDLPYRE